LLQVGVNGVVSLFLQLVGPDLVPETDAATLVAAQIHHDPLPFGGNLLERTVELHAAVAPERSEHVAGEALAVHAHEHVGLAGDLTAHEREMLGVVEQRLEHMGGEIAVLRRDARLGDTALKFALLCDEGGAFLFPRVMGLDRALKMTLLSEVYDAKKAYELGLVTEVVPHAEFEARVNDFASRLAEGPPLAVRLAKRMMYKQREMTLENSLEDAALNVMITNSSDDVKEGTRAFREKRKPKFVGR